MVIKQLICIGKDQWDNVEFILITEDNKVWHKKSWCYSGGISYHWAEASDLLMHGPNEWREQNE
jgi:hypothetical protein